VKDKDGEPLYYIGYDQPLTEDERDPEAEVAGKDVVGYAVKGSAQGYSSTISVMVGVDKAITTETDLSEVRILGVRVLSQQETPGLGAQAQTVTVDKKIWKPFEKPGEPKCWTDQFSGKLLRNIEVVKGPTEEKVQAITGATITSNAVVTAVSTGVNTLRQSHPRPVTNAGAVEGPVKHIVGIMPDADPDACKLHDDMKPVYYEVFDRNGKRIGYAVLGKGKGYAGDIELIVGLGPDVKSVADVDKIKVLGVKVISQSETPGLGSNIQSAMKEPGGEKELYWTDQFADKYYGEIALKADGGGGRIDGITGATVSSQTVVKAVREAVSGLHKHLRAGEGAR
jgi:electron transport complex protein RnfG